MLVSIALGLFILAVIYVALWSVKNDSAKSIADQVGFIRMRRPKSQAGNRRTTSQTAQSETPSRR